MHNTEGTSPESNNHIQGRQLPVDAHTRQPPPEPHSQQERVGPRIEWHDLRAICAHIIPAKPPNRARRCGSPALRGESFCYYHHPTRAPVRNLHERRARRLARQAFTLDYPTNQDELQFVLRDLVTRLAANEIDPRRAGQIIYALQTAARGMPE
jgi:hypothetical protein